MNYLNHKDFEFNTVKKALLNADAPFPPEMIDYFSDISEKDLELLKDVWPRSGLSAAVTAGRHGKPG